MPTPNARDAPPDVVISLAFNDFPDPESIGLGSIALYTGFSYHVGRYWVDLVNRRAFFKSSGNLRRGLGYTVVVRPEIRSLRGCRLQLPVLDPEDEPPEFHTIRFQVAETAGPALPRPLPPAADYKQVIDIFAGHCSGGACHLSADADPMSVAACLSDPGGDLSLCGPRAREDLVGVPSRQVARLVRVARSDSSRSYLLRKLIGAPPIIGHAGVPRNDGPAGDGGPKPGGDLSRDQLGVIQTWIDNGTPGS